VPGGAERFLKTVFGVFVQLDEFVVFHFDKWTDVVFFGE
jgi:hypothetical protein